MSSFAWLDSVGFFDMDFGLDRVLELAGRLGNPQNRLKFIHVAGSNGKGSVCSFTENGLRASGYKTGFYSSPHLVQLEERFRINGTVVDENLFFSAAEKVRLEVEKMRLEKRGPTYFEITTVIALVLFEMAHVDFVVWEVGLGGRLDATNIVHPEVSVITGISLEHTEYLGKTLGAIAGEKAGIVKAGIPVVCGPLPEEAFAVIAKKARELNAPLTAVSPYDAPYEMIRRPDGFAEQKVELNGVPVTIPLSGVYQRNNAKVAAAVLHLLSSSWGFSEERALQAMRFTDWPARMQFVPSRKLIVDGAHNPEGAEALAVSLRELYPDAKFHFISGCFADKNAEAVLNSFAPLALDFQFIEFDGSGRAVRKPEELIALLCKLGYEIPAGKADLNAALSALPAADGGLTILSGSLHMCGEALHFLGLL